MFFTSGSIQGKTLRELPSSASVLFEDPLAAQWTYNKPVSFSVGNIESASYALSASHGMTSSYAVTASWAATGSRAHTASYADRTEIFYSRAYLSADLTISASNVVQTVNFSTLDSESKPIFNTDFGVGEMFIGSTITNANDQSLWHCRAQVELKAGSNWLNATLQLVWGSFVGVSPIRVVIGEGCDSIATGSQGPMTLEVEGYIYNPDDTAWVEVQVFQNDKNTHVLNGGSAKSFIEVARVAGGPRLL